MECDIESYFCRFIDEIRFIEEYLKRQFGEVDYVKEKSLGNIANRNYTIKGSRIKGYSFHGNGCGFQFKDYVVDVEFLGSNVGFTAWSLYTWINEQLSCIDEDLVDLFLVKRINLDLISKNKIYFPDRRGL